MRVLAAVLGCALLGLVLVDCFNTIVLARRTEHLLRITRAFYWLTWRSFAAVGRRIRSSRWREGFLSTYGPLSLLMLFALWTAGLAAGFGFLQWAAGMRPAGMAGNFWNDVYLSAGTLFTLNSGEPKNWESKLISVVEGGLG